MSIPFIFIAALLAQTDVPPVPGLCSAPVPQDRDAAGCYETGSLDLKKAPSELYWHIYQYDTLADAESEAARHMWASVTQIHARIWLYLLGRADEKVQTGAEKAVIGPLKIPAGAVTAHLSKAIFPPGMQTRVHSHPGPEAFYVVEGEQCMETPTDKKIIPAGGTYIVPDGPHLQAAPHGRRNLVLIVAPKDQPFVIPGSSWKPTGFCTSP
jgi:quercetin dioxygenase-like cupin family protein